MIHPYVVGIDDPEAIIKPLANHLRPLLLSSWNERRKTLFSESANRMKRLLDDLQKKFDEVISKISSPLDLSLML